jgi:hypothetical protein
MRKISRHVRPLRINQSVQWKNALLQALLPLFPDVATGINDYNSTTASSKRTGNGLASVVSHSSFVTPKIVHPDTLRR